ncbi:MAG: DNA polymerase I [Anaerolineae bacterium]|jgi:DNA polymerase-1|nr:DNA polymerase I [Anaerolineae bacterium]MDH7473048.1 DNA polymerase I [Anaerolineae bacterium]
MPEKKKLVLIDGHALAYRAFHALPPTLSTKSGELTNATYGFTSMLLNVLRDEKPDYVIVAFDVGRTFRHDEYPEYKAQRRKMPDELHYQLERIREIVKALNIPIVEVPGYEADDVLGTLCRQAAAQGLETLIVTGDTDTFQLIDQHTRVLTSRRQFSDTVIYDEQGIKERYGLTPAQLVDYKAIVGDVSDNIPGVRGVGEKTASALLQKYGSIENIYQHLDEVQPARFRAALAEAREAALMSKHLATIVTDVPISLDLEASRFGAFDRERLKEIFRELEFRSLMDRLPGGEVSGPPQQLSLFGEEVAAPPERTAPTAHQVVDTIPALEALVERLRRARAVTFDLETTSADAMKAELVGIALTDAPGQGFYIPVGHGQPAGNQLPLDTVLNKLQPILTAPGLARYAHNGKYDVTVLARHGLPIPNLAFDTMIAEWLIDPASRNLGVKRVAPYAVADVDMTHRLVSVLEPELQARALWKLFTEIEMPLVSVLAAMEMRGVKLDVAYLHEMSVDLQQRLAALEQEIQEMVGYRFNIGSTQQLSQALFHTLGLPATGVTKTKSGHYSTAANVLENLRGKHPVIDLLLEHRQLSKLLSTYVEALPALVNPRTGRVHTSYNQTGTVTGRLSSSEPNLQNIPIRTEVGREVRRAFVADEGHVLLAADYSQVELRILAHISQDPAMLEAFHRGEDIHATTAAALYDVPISQVTPEMRRVAKTTNFAISYGVTGYGLSQQTELTPEEGNKFITAYFARFPKVKAYLDETRRRAAEQGYVETLLGRRRYFPELQSKDKVHAGARAAAERMAINTPIQGTAADIIKIAMVRLHRALHERGLQAGMILQVHDELVLEVPEDEVKTVAPLVRQIMEGAYQLDAPLKVDMALGKNWLEMEDVRT